MRRILLASFCCLAFSIPALGQSARPATKPLRPPVFDALLYQERPSTTQLGLAPIIVADRQFFRAIGPNRYDTSRGDEQATRLFARQSAGRPIVLDVEHWSVDLRKASREDVDESIRKLTEIVGWIRSEDPRASVGFYGLLPLGDYWNPVNYRTALERPASAWHRAKLPEFRTAYEQWLSANEQLRQPSRAKTLASEVDFVCPSLYVFYDDPAGNEKYYRANLAEARKFGKPVYPFVWFEYHDSNKQLAKTLIPIHRLTPLLRIIRDEADGIVLWGGFQKRWDPQIAQRVDLVRALFAEPRPR